MFHVHVEMVKRIRARIITKGGQVFSLLPPVHVAGLDARALTRGASY